MNGNESRFFDERFNDLKNLVTEIKTENRIKWDEHNKRANSLQKYLTDEFSSLKAEDKAFSKFLNSLPCSAQEERMKGIKWHLCFLWIAFGTFVTVFGIVIKVVAGG